MIEDVTRTPSKHILVEPNQHNRTTSQNELEIKVNVWGAASPPTGTEESKYFIDLIACEMAHALRNGAIVLQDALNIETIKSFSEAEKEEDGDENDDGNDTTSSIQ